MHRKHIIMDAGILLNEDSKRYSMVMSRAMEYINDKISTKLLLEDIARAAYLSPFHFLRVFKQVMGITLHQYIVALRIEKAKALLLKAAGPIEEKVRPAGFISHPHFSRVFRKMTGLTPTEYIEMFKN